MKEIAFNNRIAANQRMSEFFKAEIKDRFLEYAADRDDYFEAQLLYDEFLRPSYDMDYTIKLLREILDHDYELLDIMSGNGSKIFMLTATEKTQDFLNEGGFKQIYVNEEEKWDRFLDHLSNNRKLSNQEKAYLGKTEKEEQSRERLLLGLIIGAVAISFLFTVFSILKAFVAPPDYVSSHEFEERMLDLEIENQLLKKDIELLKVRQATPPVYKE